MSLALRPRSPGATTRRILFGFLSVLPLLPLSLAAAACTPVAAAPAACPPVAAAEPPASAAPVAAAEEEKAIAAVLDDWHAAAAAADEARYFGHLTEDAVFLGTDATERWDKKAFLAYAHPHFAKGKAWTMRAARRTIVIAEGGRAAWFDEDLETARLGPARGSGVLVRAQDGWRIAHYNLSIPIPNDRFDAVKQLIAAPPPAP